MSLTAVWYAAVSTVVDWDTLTSTSWNSLVWLVNQNETNINTNTSWIATNTAKLTDLSKVFYIRSSDANVKCISINYAPVWYTDNECIWLLNWYAFYEWKTQDNFSVYSDSSCSTLYSSRWLIEVKYWDRTGRDQYMKISVTNWFLSELFCQKWLIQGTVDY